MQYKYFPPPLLRAAFYSTSHFAVQCKAIVWLCCTVPTRWNVCVRAVLCAPISTMQTLLQDFLLLLLLLLFRAANVALYYWNWLVRTAAIPRAVAAAALAKKDDVCFNNQLHYTLHTLYLRQVNILTRLVAATAFVGAFRMMLNWTLFFFNPHHIRAFSLEGQSSITCTVSSCYCYSLLIVRRYLIRVDMDFKYPVPKLCVGEDDDDVIGRRTMHFITAVLSFSYP